MAMFSVRERVDGNQAARGAQGLSGLRRVLLELTFEKRHEERRLGRDLGDAEVLEAVDCYPLAADVPVFHDMYWGYGQRALRARRSMTPTAHFAMRPRRTTPLPSSPTISPARAVW